MNELPFERGTYTCGFCEVGAEFYDPSNKQCIQVVKNTDAAAIVPKRLVKWETPASYEADFAVATADGGMVAGVVDPLLATTGCPVNAYCFVVYEGVVTADVGSGTAVAAAGDFLIVNTTAIAADKGKVCKETAVAGAVGLLTTELAESKQIIGVAHEAAAAASAAYDSVQMRIALRR